MNEDHENHAEVASGHRSRCGSPRSSRDFPARPSPRSSTGIVYRDLCIGKHLGCRKVRETGDRSGAVTMGQVWVIMGVSGCGKTTVGRLLAERLGCAFFDGDDDHPPRNIEKMSRGIPLTDEDRWPWLDRIAARIRGVIQEENGRAVLACSALKRAYRDRLRGGVASDPRIHFVYLHGPEELLLERMNRREGHFMSPGMLRSQLDTLEDPADEENVQTLSIESPLEKMAWLIQIRW